MPNKKISQLDPLLVLSGEEFVPVLHNGANYKVSLNDIASLGGAAGPINAISQLNSSATVTDTGVDGKFEVVLDDKAKINIKGNNFDFTYTGNDAANWFVKFGDLVGAVKSEAGSSIAVDSAGNVIVIGCDSDNGYGIIIKFSSIGEVIWQKKISIVGSWITGEGVTTDSLNNIYFSVANGTPHTLIKMSPAGDIVWQTELGTTDYGFWAMGVDGEGNVIVTGYVPFPSTDVGHITKISSDGVKVWSKLIDSTFTQFAFSGITVDANGEFYIVGQRTIQPENIRASFVFKFDSLGALVWEKTISNSQAGAATITINYAIVVLNDAVYAAGRCAVSGFNRPFIYKLSKSTGDVIWAKYLDAQYEYGTIFSIAADVDAQVLHVCVIGLVAAGYSSEVYIVTIDLLGNAIGAILLGSTGSDDALWSNGHNILACRNSQIYFTGYTYVGGQSNIYVGSLPSSGIFATFGDYRTLKASAIAETATCIVHASGSITMSDNADVFIPGSYLSDNSLYLSSASYAKGMHNAVFDNVDFASAKADSLETSSLKINGVNITTTTPIYIPITCSDEFTPLTVGVSKLKFIWPVGFTLTGVHASLTVAQTAGVIFTVNVKVDGTSVLSTKLTIDNNEKHSGTAVTPAVVLGGAYAYTAFSEFAIDIDQVGTSGATGLKLYLIGYK